MHSYNTFYNYVTGTYFIVLTVFFNEYEHFFRYLYIVCCASSYHKLCVGKYHINTCIIHLTCKSFYMYSDNHAFLVNMCICTFFADEDMYTYMYLYMT